MNNNGILYIVATPIGNLRDITLRAVDVLKNVSVIACEDTRRSMKLLSYYNIDTRLVSYHSFNEKSRVDKLISILKNGEDVALISDAGTPLLSDPGQVLVDACIETHIQVIPVPGPSALTSAISVCHFEVEQFCFLGFIPSRKTRRRKVLANVKTSPMTLVFYEAPHRIVDFIKDAIDILGDRECVLCRELTKVHEEVLRGKLSQIDRHLMRKTTQKGEFTIIIDGAKNNVTDLEPDLQILSKHCIGLLKKGFSAKQTIQIFQEIFGLSRNDAYLLVVNIKGQANK